MYTAKTQGSRFDPMNRERRKVFSLSSSGGEGRGEQAQSACQWSRQRAASKSSGGRCPFLTIFRGMRFPSCLTTAAIALLCSSHFCAAAPDPASASPVKPTFWLIPHTHWEGAVFKTREEYLEMGLPNILTAIRLLKEHPNYRFTLDQVAYFKPFLERYPEEAAAFRKFVAEGRLQIVCGLDIMPDDNMPSGESFVRQMVYAKGFCRDALGADVKVGWLLDTFGHHAQMPQVLRLAGFNSFWFFRGVENRKTMPSEFVWEGIDGSRIPSFWLPFAYGHLYGPPKDLPRFTDFMKK